MVVKILASDFDDTLYFEKAVSDYEKEIFKKNISAIKQFVKNGNLFCIITGRSYSDIKVLLNEYDIPYSYLICADGAKIFNNMDYCIDTVLLDSEKVSQVIKILAENNCEYVLDDGYNNTLNINDCIKIAAEYQERDTALKIIEQIKKEIDVYVYISTEHINIIDISVNKYNALKKLLNLEKLSFSEVYVIGDEINDLEMIREFDGAVMKKHNPILDSLNKKEYEYLYQYIEELRKN